MSSDTQKVNTGDGSSTLFSTRFNEHYHSTHGALQESLHVFIKSGLAHAAEIFNRVNLLEYGFGTGLNALLALQFSVEKGFPVNYHGFEAFPIESIDLLPDYPSQVGALELRDGFEKLHLAKSGKQVSPIQDVPFVCQVEHRAFEGPLPMTDYHVVFFDAFSPGHAPECWEPWIFELIFQSMATNGCLVTYCAKGDIRRRLQSVGFEVEKLPGPPGKREILRANKR